MNNDKSIVIADDLFSQISHLIKSARNNVVTQINTTLLMTYWNIGRLIVEDEQKNELRAEYGQKILIGLSKRLTKEYGKGFSRSNLHWMRMLYA